MVSIIVPNYNHRNFLPLRLDTIFNQSFQHFEIILLDDCSTDDSWEYLKQYENHPKVSHCIRNEINSGSPFRQWEMGLDLAKYDWVWIAESDDFSDLTFLETCFSKISESINLVFCQSQIIDEDGFSYLINGKAQAFKGYQLGDREIYLTGSDFVKKYLVFKNYILNASSVIFKKKPFFPPMVCEMKYAGDWYFWISMLKDGDIIYLPSSLNFFRYHKSSTRMGLNSIDLLRKNSEILKCIKFGVKNFNPSFVLIFNNKEYFELIDDIFFLGRKLGRKKLLSLFFDIPYYLKLRFLYLITIHLTKKNNLIK